MQILLTGATGCLGQALVTELSGAGHSVVALMRPGATFAASRCRDVVPMDLGRPLEVWHLPARCDAVVHVAQSRNYRKSEGAELDIFRINTAATVELASYAATAGARGFFYASTGTLYRPSPDPIPETGAISAATFYAASKLASEQMLAPFSTGMTVTIGRLFHLYGPGQRDKLLNDIAGRLRSGKAIDLRGENGLQLAPTYSSDAARLIRLGVEEGWDGVYNMASPEFVSLREFTEEMGRILGLTPTFARQPGNAPDPVLPDLTKLKKRLTDWRFTPLHQGFRQTLLQSTTPSQ